jgi:hypothetical protein
MSFAQFTPHLLAEDQALLKRPILRMGVNTLAQILRAFGLGALVALGLVLLMQVKPVHAAAAKVSWPFAGAAVKGSK